MIEKAAEFEDFDNITRDNWPTLNEESYVGTSANQESAAASASQKAEAASTAASGVSENMQGLTSDAGVEALGESANRFTAHAATHSNRATVAAMLATNIANTKLQLNANAAAFDTNDKALKVQAVANEWTQNQLSEERAKLVQQHQDAADKIGSNFESADSELTEQFVNSDEPSVPSSMVSAPSGQSAGLDLPPGADSSMQQMMGQAGGAAQQLGQALGKTPGADVINPALQNLTQMMSGAGEQAITPDALDQLLSGQDTGDGADSGSSSDSHDDNEPPPPPPVTSTTGASEGTAPGATASGSSGGVSASPVGNTSGLGAPSPAQSVTTAAPPASATMPSTHISSDSGPSASPAPSGGIGGGSTAAPQAMPAASAGDMGTSLSSDSSTATAPPPAAPSAPMTGGGLGSGATMGAGSPMMGGVGAGAPMMGGAGAGAMGGGAPAAGIAPSVGAVPHSVTQFPSTPGTTPLAGTAPTTGHAAAFANTTAAGAGVSPLAPSTPAGTPQSGGASSDHPSGPHGSVVSAQSMGGVAPFPISTGTQEMGTVYHVSAQYTPDEKAAGTLIATLMTAFSARGFHGPVAVAILSCGTGVFATADGIGVIPSGVSLPENVVPLSEFPSVNAQFRADMAGCCRPGFVLRVAADQGLIPEIKALMSTEDVLDSRDIIYVTEDMLRGAPAVASPITRDLFGRVSDEDTPLALESLKLVWGVTPDPNELSDTEYAVMMTRWESEANPKAVQALATWLLTDAELAMREGRLADAGYTARQLLWLPESHSALRGLGD